MNLSIAASVLLIKVHSRKRVILPVPKDFLCFVDMPSFLAQPIKSRPLYYRENSHGRSGGHGTVIT